MDNQIKTSFIPRKTIDAAVNFQSTPRAPHKVGRTLFSLIATLIFLGVIAMGVLTYLWQIKLKKDLDNQVLAMKSALDNFPEKFVKDASRLDFRIQQSTKMLENHVSPSSLYGLLEEYTLQTVSFSQFSFKDNSDGTISVSGSGKAAGYPTIVLQSDAFGKSGYLRNVIFTNLSQDEKTKEVSFAFEGSLDPRLIFYSESLKSEANQSQN